MTTDTTLPATLSDAWQSFALTYEPLRAPLFRYCRYLTRGPWDAEDLVQDTLARAFVLLAQMRAPPRDPRAWLLRVASNLWIDRTRHAAVRERFDEAHAEIPTAPEPRAPREAAGTLLVQLSPQQRAAVVLKDVFDLSLDEIAEVLGTTVGAVKIALHRGRGKLADPEPEAPRAPAPGVLDAFCAAFNARDLPALTALLLDNAAVEVVGATMQYGPDAASRTVLPGMLFGSTRMADAERSGGMDPQFVQGVLPNPPRVEVHAHRGRWVLVHWYEHVDGEFVRAITELQIDDDGVAGLRNYFFTPDFIADVCDELGLPHRSNGHRWCAPARDQGDSPCR